MATNDNSKRAGPPPSGMPPMVNLAPRDVAELAAELVAYHRLFAPLFWREEQRYWALKYLQGQMLELERKSIEPMALALEGGNVQAMQQFISIGAWDDETILRAHQRLVADTLGDAQTGVLIIDGCQFPKQGQHSVGVARQYCGALGKIANCQSSVLACYASARGYTLVDGQLFVPEPWFSAEYRERRAQCAVPDDLTFQKHHELAAQLIRTLRERAELPFSWVTFDEDYGRATVLLDEVANLGLTYMAEVALNTYVYANRPQRVLPANAAEDTPSSPIWVWPAERRAVRVEQLAERIPPGEWQRQVIKVGAKGPLVAEFAFRRVVAVRDEKPGPEVWVVFRRSVGATPELKVYLSNAGAEIPQETLVWVSGMRWPIESVIEECKGELGLDHYEVRGWLGWHHHLTMTLLAHHFLVWLRLRLSEKGGGTYRAPGPPAADRRVAQAPAHRARSHFPNPRNSAAQLCRLSISLPAYHAPAR